LELVVVQDEQFLSPFLSLLFGDIKIRLLSLFDCKGSYIWPIELSNSKPLPRSYLLLFF